MHFGYQTINQYTKPHFRQNFDKLMGMLYFGYYNENNLTFANCLQSGDKWVRYLLSKKKESK